MAGQCPNINPEIIDAARMNLRRYQIGNPVVAIDESAIVQALKHPETPYFITTELFWDCECSSDYIRSADMLMCEVCGMFRSDAPPSRINEIRQAGIHVDWTATEIQDTLSEFSVSYRHAPL